MTEVLTRYPHAPSQSYKSRFSRSDRREIRSAAHTSLRHTTQPLLEIGGPTEHGFVALGKKRLPNGVIISNVEPTEGASQIVDVRKLPYERQSLGGVLMSALTRMPEEFAKAPREVEGVHMDYQPRSIYAVGEMLKLVLCEREQDYSLWGDEDFMNFNLRLAMLKEARLKVEPNGVIIANTLLSGELRLAKQLGFEMAATTVPEINRHIAGYNFGEFVLTLADLETPAGQYVESVAN